MMGKILEITLNKLNEIIEKQAKRITKLVYKNKTLTKRAESAEEDWQITEQIRDQLRDEIKELEGYKEGARDCLRSAKKRIEELERGISDAIELMDEEPAKKILMQLKTE